MVSTLQGRKIFDLDGELYHRIPHHSFQAPYPFQLIREHGDLIFGDGVSSAVELFGMTGHTRTLLDGFGHLAKNLCLHGEIPDGDGSRSRMSVSGE